MHRIACLLLFASTASADPKPPKRTLAVVEVIERFDECSGAGGEHYVLRIHDGKNPPRLAHAGGHAVYLGLLKSSWPAKTPPPSTFYVAELDGSWTGPRAVAGWCIDKLPTFSAHATRLVRATSKADAEKLLKQKLASGMPGPSPKWPGGTVVLDLDRSTAR